jgi:hypothetical protein
LLPGDTIVPGWPNGEPVPVFVRGSTGSCNAGEDMRGGPPALGAPNGVASTVVDGSVGNCSAADDMSGGPEPGIGGGELERPARGIGGGALGRFVRPLGELASGALGELASFGNGITGEDISGGPPAVPCGACGCCRYPAPTFGDDASLPIGMTGDDISGGPPAVPCGAC